MSNVAPAFITLNPSYTLPEIILPYTQVSGCYDLLAGGEPQVRLSDGDLVVYAKRIDLRTRMASGQSAYNQLPSVSTTLSQISTATYLFRVRAEYDHHDTAAMSRWGVSIVDTNRLGMQQGHNQLLRTANLYGINPANGEGLLNTNGATSTSLPADSNGNDTIVTYDNGQMSFFLLSLISGIKSRTNQLGIGRDFTICMPQRVGAAFEYQNIVQLVQYQRPGAGSTSTAGVVKDVLEMNGDKIKWVYDDTLIGKGPLGGDAIIITMPEVEKPMGNKFNTNVFAEVSPGMSACTMQLTDMAAPREIPVPLPGGAIDVVSELRATSGWAIRSEAVTILSAVYQ